MTVQTALLHNLKLFKYQYCSFFKNIFSDFFVIHELMNDLVEIHVRNFFNES